MHFTKRRFRTVFVGRCSLLIADSKRSNKTTIQKEFLIDHGTMCTIIKLMTHSWEVWGRDSRAYISKWGKMRSTWWKRCSHHSVSSPYAYILCAFIFDSSPSTVFSLNTLCQHMVHSLVSLKFAFSSWCSSACSTSHVFLYSLFEWSQVQSESTLSHIPQWLTWCCRWGFVFRFIYLADARLVVTCSISVIIILVYRQ